MATQITLSGTSTIESVLNEFTKVFPDLKLEFFHHAHDPGAISAPGDQWDHSALISEIRSMDHGGSFSFNPEMTVVEFEQTLEKEWGLHVQVLRRSGDLWLQSTVTDHWTLGKQNDNGFESRQFARK